MKPFACWRYAATCAQLPSLCVDSGAHVCCFRSQLYVNGVKLCDEDTDLGMEYALTRLLDTQGGAIKSGAAADGGTP